MQVLYFFSRQNYKTFDILHAFLPLTVAKLSTLKNSPFFGPPYITFIVIAVDYFTVLKLV